MWWTDSFRGWFLMKFCPSSTSNLEVVQVNSTKPEHSWFRLKVQTQPAMRSYFFVSWKITALTKKHNSMKASLFLLFMFLFPLKAPFSFFLSVKWNFKFFLKLYRLSSKKLQCFPQIQGNKNFPEGLAKFFRSIPEGALILRFRIFFLTPPCLSYENLSGVFWAQPFDI